MGHAGDGQAAVGVAARKRDGRRAGVPAVGPLVPVTDRGCRRRRGIDRPAVADRAADVARLVNGPDAKRVAAVGQAWQRQRAARERPVVDAVQAVLVDQVRRGGDVVAAREGEAGRVELRGSAGSTVMVAVGGVLSTVTVWSVFASVTESV